MKKILFSAVAAVAGLSACAATSYKTATPEALSHGMFVSTWTPETDSPVRFTAVKVDLTREDVTFTGTGRAGNYGAPLADTNTIYNVKEEKIEPATVITRRESPRSFIVRSKTSLAFCSRSTRRPYDAEFACPFGLFIVNGNVVSSLHTRTTPAFVVRKNGTMEFADRVMPIEFDDIVFAAAGDAIIRRNGAVCGSGGGTQERNGTLVIGLTADRKCLFVLSGDDGRRARHGVGPTMRETSDALAELGVADAMVFERGSATAIYAVNKGDEVVQVNKTGAEESKPLVACNMALRFKEKPLFPKSTSSSKKQQNDGPQEISAVIKQGRLNSAKDRPDRKSPERTVLRGQVRVAVKSDKPRFKRPILHIIALFEQDGIWKYYDTILTEQKSSSGRTLGSQETPGGVSRSQPEVSADQWLQPIFGEPKVGYFRSCRITPDNPKLLAYRVELWQNGGLVTFLDGMDAKTLKKAGVPEDWHIKGKHPGNFVYYWPPPPPEKK